MLMQVSPEKALLVSPAFQLVYESGVEELTQKKFVHLTDPSHMPSGYIPVNLGYW
jgi:hypothetical protein